MRFATLLLLPVCALTACERQQSEPLPESAQQIAISEIGPPQASAYPSPDTSAAGWTVAEDGQAILFSNPGEAPWLTLACDLSETPARFTIIRHAEALPGQSALFPFVGNGMRSRFLADATLAQTAEGGEWRWEASLPADDPQLDIFEGARGLTATLPGRGMLEIAGSRIPGQFLTWCRADGRQPDPIEVEETTEE
ncbi:hypothetical protein [Aurantiacibacter sp. D1-12]|uniref:hypothetical protein n=1 Tax=Aurantiacibacter sp. D1-12 TaxID=2993658 RepID=UPI00237CDB55|nr:hypothetical protein [Aurantiacibacter sp. D1-12]MDE1467811.1 hypothetical protein [Aurantiacibacter sp. D1-12]